MVSFNGLLSLPVGLAVAGVVELAPCMSFEADVTAVAVASAAVPVASVVDATSPVDAVPARDVKIADDGAPVTPDAALVAELVVSGAAVVPVIPLLAWRKYLVW